MRPEEVLEAARRAAAAARHEVAALDGLRVEPTDRIGTEQLLEWAVIEPDPELLRSTRTLGRPITWIKRLLRRALRQELDQLAAQQTRFNLHLLERVTELEERLREDGRPPGPERRGPG